MKTHSARACFRSKLESEWTLVAHTPNLLHLLVSDAPHFEIQVKTYAILQDIDEIDEEDEDKIMSFMQRLWKLENLHANKASTSEPRTRNPYPPADRS